ncbi:flagellar brake protein [Ferviditalea candida]|uniref:Flagellar brake domain-containing protein n=1 Tax=Ferviditalea candida TaxID=3108399 RepID=A0ABU5ZJY2_9BACL|nr:flagellar brake domain-containing protein [Paenibacillaceae bacterium T2]
MLPKINDILFIQVNSVDEEEAQKEFKSRIADIRDEVMSIEIPIEVRTGRLKKLYTGDQLSIYYMSEGGVKNYFNTQVEGFKRDVISLVLIRKPKPEAITKVQRRTFLRVPAELEISVKLADHHQFLAITEDVGGGGISMLCDGKEPIMQKDAVSCWLLIPYRNGTVDHVPFKAEVVRTKELDTGRRLVMLGFTEISDADRQKVIRYCFERQLELRKN